MDGHGKSGDESFGNFPAAYSFDISPTGFPLIINLLVSLSSFDVPNQYRETMSVTCGNWYILSSIMYHCIRTHKLGLANVTVTALQ